MYQLNHSSAINLIVRGTRIWVLASVRAIPASIQFLVRPFLIEKERRNTMYGVLVMLPEAEEPFSAVGTSN